MSKAHVCDVCGETIKPQEFRTILRVESAKGSKSTDSDYDDDSIDVCERCRSNQAEAVVQTITTAVLKLRKPAGKAQD